MPDDPVNPGDIDPVDEDASRHDPSEMPTLVTKKAQRGLKFLLEETVLDRLLPKAKFRTVLLSHVGHEKELELAQKGHKTAEALLESGRISQLDMEDAELTLMQAELGLLQYKLEFQTSLAALQRIIGRKDLSDAFKNL